MKILAIETSCDETAVAVVENGRQILVNIVASSKEVQAGYGGVYPEVAARKQIEFMLPVLKTALSKYHLTTIDALAVTTGPGLIGSLLVGVETAKTIAFLYHKPLVAVNHVLAHLYANWLNPALPPPQLPALCLIVSGGHTQLLLLKNHGCFQLLGQTLDDAAGEAFDKTARLLGFSYPGGPQIAAAAADFNQSKIKFQVNLPRPMLKSGDFNFSFSGLKTAVLRETKRVTKLTKEVVSAFAYEIQEAITDVLVAKTLTAWETFKPKSILISGGVAANFRLKEKFTSEIQKKKYTIPLFIPPASLCTDNAAIIASFAFFNYQPQAYWQVKASVF